MIAPIIIISISVIIAFWISSICGGGASLILIPILNIYLPGSEVPFAITVGTFTSSASRLIVFKKHINWKVFWGFVPAAVPAVFLGAYLINYLNPDILQLFIALFLLGNVGEVLKPSSYTGADKGKIGRHFLMIIGVLAGLISGITGAVGLLFNKFYFKLGLTKEEILATRAANEIFLHLIKLVTYFYIGLYSRNALVLGLIIAVSAVLSTHSIKYILPYLTDKSFKRIGYCAMVISGAFLLCISAKKVTTGAELAISSSFKNNQWEIKATAKNTAFVMEFSRSNLCEIEFEVQPEQLPKHLLEEYQLLKKEYNIIRLERVFSLISKSGYEFYCYSADNLIKIYY